MRKNIIRNTLILFFVVALGGCAVGNTYDYRVADLGIPVNGMGQSVSVEVVDARPYVLNGRKSSNFIGLQRGGYGNPFDVTTSSGQPLAEEFEAVIASSLAKSNFAVGGSAGKTVKLTVREWKTDAMSRLRLIYDMTLAIRSDDNTKAASVSDKGDEVLSAAGMESANSASASAAFERKLSRLFADNDIREALER